MLMSFCCCLFNIASNEDMLENDYTLRLDHLQIAEFKVSPTYWI